MNRGGATRLTGAKMIVDYEQIVPLSLIHDEVDHLSGGDAAYTHAWSPKKFAERSNEMRDWKQLRHGARGVAHLIGRRYIFDSPPELALEDVIENHTICTLIVGDDHANI